MRRFASIGLFAIASLGATDGNPHIFLTGADSVVVEGIKDFQKTCPSVTVTSRQDNADYSVLVADDGSGAGRKGRSAVASTVSGDNCSGVIGEGTWISHQKCLRSDPAGLGCEEKVAHLAQRTFSPLPAFPGLAPSL